MAKFKVGDIVTPCPCEDNFLHEYLIRGANYVVEEVLERIGLITVKGEFREGGNGRDWCEDWFELASSNSSAESLHNSILDIRSKREDLQKEILQLDEQEKEAVQKLKGLGFVLYEENVSKELDAKELVVTEKKAVLYAEDIEEDMTNYENWKNGDILEVTTYCDKMVPFGTLVEHVDVDGNTCPFTNSEYHDCWAIAYCYLKFHSRQVK